MSRPAKKTNGGYIEAGYQDKVVFRPKKKGRRDASGLAPWKWSQGLWSDHPVFQSRTVKEAIEYLRGADCDVWLRRGFRILASKVNTVARAFAIERIARSGSFPNRRTNLSCGMLNQIKLEDAPAEFGVSRFA